MEGAQQIRSFLNSLSWLVSLVIFTLPAAGAYTIGVFRISLVEPAEVAPTVFQLRGSLTTN